MVSIKSWFETRPEAKSKNDLVGLDLTVLADKPPVPSTKQGIFELTVMNTANSTTYRVLVTNKDLDAICAKAKKGEGFSFDLHEGSEWADVV